MLLVTNTGAKIGFVLAATGLSGWIFVMAVIWAIYGIGMKGREPHWKVTEAVQGSVGGATLEELEGFPRRWTEATGSDRVRAEAQAAADAFLVPTAEAEGAHGGGGGGAEEEPPRFTSPFRTTGEYIVTGIHHRWGTDDGEDNELFTIGKHKFYFRHAPHYALVQVQPVLEQDETGGAPAEPRPDPSQPPVNVVMVRDLGSVRQPPLMIALVSGIVFGVCCYWLHDRDKRIWAARNAEPVPAT
jgi:hypothetical protein